jgi:predicted DNA binding CopG/RHH family protein
VLANLVIMSHAHAMPNSSEDVDVTIRVPTPLFESASSIAAQEGLNIHELVVRAIRREIEEISARTFASTLDELLSQDRKILRRLGEE